MSPGRIMSHLMWPLVGVVCFSSMLFYTERIWSANRPAHFSDLYARWWGAHELFLHGRNPYSPEISHEIQKVIYGDAVVPSTDDPTGIGGGFAYPPYTAFLLWPTIYVSFSTAEKLFLFLSIALTLLSMALWLRVLSISMTRWRWIALSLFVFGSFPVQQGLKLLNLSLIAAALIAIAIALLYSEAQVWAGVFMAISTFKPQFAILLAPWLMLWCLAGWRRRWRFALGFAMMMLLLVLASELVLPSGFADFLAVARAYPHYAYGYSLLEIWFTPGFGLLASGALVLVAVKMTWRSLSAEANEMEFVSAISLLLTTTVAVIPSLAPHVQLLLLPAVILLVKYRHPVWNSRPTGRFVLVTVAVMLSWPWIAALALMISLSWMPIRSLLPLWQIPLFTSPLFALAVFLALAYLIRQILRRKTPVGDVAAVMSG